MWSDIIRKIEESIHRARCHFGQQEDEALFQQCVESFESFYDSEGFRFWGTTCGVIVLTILVGNYLWVQGTMTLRHLALFRNTGTILMSIIAIITIPSGLYAAYFILEETEISYVYILAALPFIILYTLIIYNSNSSLLEETSPERRLKINTLLFSQLAIILAATTLIVTSVFGLFVGPILIYISLRLRAHIHERWGI